jgi:hypothetical protein
MYGTCLLAVEVGLLWLKVLLRGFQKGRDIKASYGKGQGAVLAQKGQFAFYKEKLCFNTFKTL